MQELDFLLKDDIDWIMIAFLCVFSLGFSLFYTIIFSTFYTKNLRPNWLFFPLFPGILIITKILVPKYVLFAMVCMFIGLFILIVIGFIKKGSSSLIKEFRNKPKNKTNISVALLLLKNVVIMSIAAIGFFLLGPYVFILIFIYIGILGFIKFNSKNSFINVQANLPTSKIASMAMGLVEVAGKVKIQQPLLSRIGKKECIGYRYKIENRTKNKDGKYSYSTISDETTCNPFVLEDHTGKVQIQPVDITFQWVPEDDSYSSGSKRYTQYLLFNNDKILLIGKANSKDNQVFIEKEPIREIFALAPFNKVTQWNRYKPLLNSFVSFMMLLVICIAMVLIADIELIKNTIKFSFNLSWDNLKSPFN